MRKRPNDKKIITSLVLGICAGALLGAPALARTFTPYEEALEDIEKEQFQTAEAKLKRLIAKNPADADAHAELARVYMDLNQIEQAIAESTHAIELNPKITRAYSTRSYCEFQRNKMKEGFADSDKVIKFYTINPLDWALWHAHKNRAQAFKMLHRNKEYAAEELNAQIFNALQEAESTRETGSLDVAAEKITDAIKVNSKIPDLWFFRGVINSNQGQFADAISDFDKAIANASIPSPTLYYFRADSYQQLGKHQQAIDDLTRIIQAKPRLVAYRYVCETGRLRNELMRDDTSPISLGDIYVLRAQSYAALKKNALASKDLETAGRLDPTDDKAIAKEAELTLGSGKFDKAIRGYTKSVAANPKDWTRYKERADAYMQVGKTKEALADYSRVIKLTPNEPGAFMLRAVAFKSLKKYDEAIADLSKVLELRNDDDDAYMERAECYRAMHRYQDALADLDKAATLAHASKTYVREARAKVIAESTTKQNQSSATAKSQSSTTTQKQSSSDNKPIFLIVIIGATLFLLGLIAANKKNKS